MVSRDRFRHFKGCGSSKSGDVLRYCVKAVGLLKVGMFYVIVFLYSYIVLYLASLLGNKRERKKKSYLNSVMSVRQSEKGPLVNLTPTRVIGKQDFQLSNASLQASLGVFMMDIHIGEHSDYGWANGARVFNKLTKPVSST